MFSRAFQEVYLTQNGKCYERQSCDPATSFRQRRLRWFQTEGHRH